MRHRCMGKQLTDRPRSLHDCERRVRGAGGHQTSLRTRTGRAVMHSTITCSEQDEIILFGRLGSVTVAIAPSAHGHCVTAGPHAAE